MKKKIVAKDISNATEIMKKGYGVDVAKELKKGVKITESQLRNIITESVKKVLNEISFSNYDDPSVRKGFLDGDEFSNDGTEIQPSVDPEYNYDEQRWNELLAMRDKGLLTDEELDAIRDKFGY